MLDDKDVFYTREVSDFLNESRDFAPKWCSALFLLFNLLAARGVYYNLVNFNAGNPFPVTTIVVSFILWSLTFTVLIVHNRLFKKLDQILGG